MWWSCKDNNSKTAKCKHPHNTIDNHKSTDKMSEYPDKGNIIIKADIYWAKIKKHYTFIIQIANTILNQCISLYLYKIGQITKAIFCLKLKVICHA